MQPDRDPSSEGGERTTEGAARASRSALPGGRVSVDEMSAASFPASDPPATWTWEVPTRAAEHDASGES